MRRTFLFFGGIMEKIIYSGVFDTKDKSYDEKTVISAEAFCEIKKSLDNSSDGCLKLIKLFVGIAVDAGTSLTVSSNGDGETCVKITADSPLCFDSNSVILLGRICDTAKSFKIETESGMCAVFATV